MIRVTHRSHHRLLWLPLLLLTAVPAAAQVKPLQFNATLETFKVTARPGQVSTRIFRLTLPADQPRTQFRAVMEDWWKQDDVRQTEYGPAGTLRRSCAPWTVLNPVESTVEPGSTLLIRISVAVPAEVDAGGYWCALTVNQVPDPAKPRTGVGVQFLASVSTAVFVDTGVVARDLRILDLTLDKDAVAVRIENAGNAPLFLTGRLEFFEGASDTPVTTVEIPNRTLLTEPRIRGTVRVALPPVDRLPNGRYRTRVLFDYGADHYVGAEQDVDLSRSR